MNRSTQVTNSFAVNDTHLQDAALPTSRKVVRHELLYFFRLEGVKVKNAINGKLYNIVLHDSHSRNERSSSSGKCDHAFPVLSRPAAGRDRTVLDAIHK